MNLGMNIVQCLVEYSIECYKYILGYNILDNKPLKRKWILCFGGFLLIVLIAFGIIKQPVVKSLLITFIAMIGSFGIMVGEIKVRVAKILELIVLNLAVDTLSGIIVGKILSEIGANPDDSLMLLINGCGTLILYIMTLVMKKTGVWLKFINYFARRIILLAYLMTFNLFFAIAALNYASSFIADEPFTTVAYFLRVFAYISIGIIIILAIELKKRNTRISQMFTHEKYQREMQEYYYNELLAKEEETRRYRHDMCNHIICLQSMAERGDVNDLQRYLADMGKVIINKPRNIYQSGQKVLDILTIYQLAQLGDDVEKSVTGYISGELEIADMDLSIIYGNILQNAMDELKKEGDNKYIKIEFMQGDYFWGIEVKNSLSYRSKTKKSITKSEKNDLRNHGFGLRNIDDAIKKYNGSLQIKKEQGTFIATLMFPNK